MPADSIHQTLDDFLRPLQAAISCVCPSVIKHGGPSAVNKPCAVLVGENGTIKLRGPQKLRLNIKLNYEIINHPTTSGFYKVKTTLYIYSIRNKKDEELLRFDWHPNISPDDPVRYPHLHIADSRLKKYHIPTSRVTIEQILRLLITHFDVKPPTSKKNKWEAILAKGIRDVEEHCSWRIEPPD